MIKIKYFLDVPETDDGQRIWVEPIGLTYDLREWCKVDNVLSHVGPPRGLWEWFQTHPQGYEFFRARYHQWLMESPYKPALQQLACAAVHDNITLLHQEDDLSTIPPPRSLSSSPSWKPTARRINSKGWFQRGNSKGSGVFSKTPDPFDSLAAQWHRATAWRRGWNRPAAGGSAANPLPGRACS